jgi:hypothetical protein
LDLSTFLIVLSGKNKKNGFYFSDKRSILKIYEERATVIKFSCLLVLSVENLESFQRKFKALCKRNFQRTPTSFTEPQKPQHRKNQPSKSHNLHNKFQTQ